MRKLFLLLFLLCALGAGAKTITLADPTIYYEDGYFYLTGTYRAGSGFNMYRSTDLVHWTSVGNARDGLCLWKEDTFGTDMFWAPQLLKHNGKYYFAYAANEQIGIAVGDSPMGPFKQENIKEVTHTSGQIDPFIFIDDDGKAFLYYVRFDGSNSLYVAPLKDDLSDISASPTFCLRPADDGWEHAKNYSNYKVSEGPTVIKDGGYYYLLYSCNDFHDIDYAVGYAYSKKPTGPWTKVGKPFLSRHNTGMNGSGHGDLFKDGNGQWYYVFHVHASNTSVGTRRTAVVPVTLTDNPRNKFVPDVSRLMLLDDAAPSATNFPSGDDSFEVDGIHYKADGSYAAVTFGDPISFGTYQGDLTVPATVKHGNKTYRVNSVASGAFYNCSKLDRVNLPSNVTSIADFAFEGSSVREVQIPSNCTTIGRMAFASCDKLLDVVVNRNSPVSIGDDAFSATAYSKAKLWVPSGREANYSAADGWKNFVKRSGVTTGKQAYDMQVGPFFYSHLRKGECAVANETNAYYTYRGPEIAVPDSIEFEGDMLAVMQVGKAAFRECHLIESVVLSAPIDTIQAFGFYNCFDLRSVEFPATLNYIGPSAFTGCTWLKTVTCHAVTPPALPAKSVFNNATYSGILRVPEGCAEAYKADPIWQNFTTIEEIEGSGISNPTHHPTSVSASGLYTIDGQRVGDGLRPLRHGIYVSGGRKIVF